MYKEMVDTIELDISEFSKEITYETAGGKILVTYNLNFPPHSGYRSFKKDTDAKIFIEQIKKEGDKVTYK